MMAAAKEMSVDSAEAAVLSGLDAAKNRTEGFSRGKDVPVCVWQEFSSTARLTAGWRHASSVADTSDIIFWLQQPDTMLQQPITSQTAIYKKANHTTGRHV